MFITMKQLRDSSAIQSRVTKVNTFLKKHYSLKDWPVEALFPSEFVHVSNGQEDYNWVENAIPALPLHGKSLYPNTIGVGANKGDTLSKIVAFETALGAYVPGFKSFGLTLIRHPSTDNSVSAVDASISSNPPVVTKPVVKAPANKPVSATITFVKGNLGNKSATLKTKADVLKAIVELVKNPLVSHSKVVTKGAAKTAKTIYTIAL